MSNKIAGFSRTYARTFGPDEAVVMRFMAHHIQRAITTKRNRRDGKYWYYNPLTTLARKLPFPRSTIADILKRLVGKNQIERGNFNKLRKLDRTWWYTAPQAVLDAVEEDIIYFNRRVTRQYGLCAGVLCSHIAYHLSDEPYFWLRVRPGTMAELIPWSADSISDTLAEMVKGGVIFKDSAGDRFYRLNLRDARTAIRNGYLPVDPDEDEEDSDDDA